MNIDNQKDYWDKVAPTKNFTHPVDMDLLAKYVGKNGRIVDYGCGYGRVVQLLIDEGYANVTGYDTSKELVKRGAGLPLVHIEAPHDLPLTDNSVDCILLFAVLTCIPSNEGQAALVQLLHTKLKPGGVLYISDYYLQEGSTEMDRYTCLNDDPENYGVFTLPEGATFRHHTQEWIATLLKDFTVQEEKPVTVSTMNGHTATAFRLMAMK